MLFKDCYPPTYGLSWERIVGPYVKFEIFCPHIMLMFTFEVIWR